MRRLTAFYGAHPMHLMTLLGCFALAGYATLHTSTNPSWPRMLAWFLAAIVGHDLILFPLYALLDRSLTTVTRVPRPRRSGPPPVPAVNHIRIPALGAGLLFLLFFPGILRQGASTYLAATGQTQQPYLQRWLLLTAALFGLSTLAYAIRLRRAGTSQRTAAKATARAIRPLTKPGERILATAYRCDGTAGAIATTYALYHPTTDGWQRIRWVNVADVHWRQDDRHLVVTGLPGTTPITLTLAGPARLPAVAQALITATLITTRRVHLDATHQALITARKSPWSDDLVWTVQLDPACDPDAPDVQAGIDDAITTIRTDLGLPLTTGTGPASTTSP